jgi:ABC-type amino acid transport system permease subunit
MASNDDHPFLVPYLAILFWCAAVVLIGAVVRLFRPSFSLWNWIFRGFPGSALRPGTWGKEAVLLIGAFVISLLIMWIVFGVKPGRSRQ